METTRRSEQAGGIDTPKMPAGTSARAGTFSGRGVRTPPADGTKTFGDALQILQKLKSLKKVVVHYEGSMLLRQLGQITERDVAAMTEAQQRQLHTEAKTTREALCVLFPDISPDVLKKLDDFSAMLQKALSSKPQATAPNLQADHEVTVRYPSSTPRPSVTTQSPVAKGKPLQAGGESTVTETELDRLLRELEEMGTAGSTAPSPGKPADKPVVAEPPPTQPSQQLSATTVSAQPAGTGEPPSVPQKPTSQPIGGTTTTATPVAGTAHPAGKVEEGAETTPRGISSPPTQQAQQKEKTASLSQPAVEPGKKAVTEMGTAGSTAPSPGKPADKPVVAEPPPTQPSQQLSATAVSAQPAGKGEPPTVSQERKPADESGAPIKPPQKPTSQPVGGTTTTATPIGTGGSTAGKKEELIPWEQAERELEEAVRSQQAESQMRGLFESVGSFDRQQLGRLNRQERKTLFTSLKSLQRSESFTSSDAATLQTIRTKLADATPIRPRSLSQRLLHAASVRFGGMISTSSLKKQMEQVKSTPEQIRHEIGELDRKIPKLQGELSTDTELQRFEESFATSVYKGMASLYEGLHGVSRNRDEVNRRLDAKISEIEDQIVQLERSDDPEKQKKIDYLQNKVLPILLQTRGFPVGGDWAGEIRNNKDFWQSKVLIAQERPGKLKQTQDALNKAVAAKAELAGGESSVAPKKRSASEPDIPLGRVQVSAAPRKAQSAEMPTVLLKKEFIELARITDALPNATSLEQKQQLQADLDRLMVSKDFIAALQKNPKAVLPFLNAVKATFNVDDTTSRLICLASALPNCAARSLLEEGVADVLFQENARLVCEIQLPPEAEMAELKSKLDRLLVLSKALEHPEKLDATTRSKLNEEHTKLQGEVKVIEKRLKSSFPISDMATPLRNRALQLERSIIPNLFLGCATRADAQRIATCLERVSQLCLKKKDMSTYAAIAIPLANFGSRVFAKDSIEATSFSESADSIGQIDARDQKQRSIGSFKSGVPDMTPFVNFWETRKEKGVGMSGDILVRFCTDIRPLQANLAKATNMHESKPDIPPVVQQDRLRQITETIVDGLKAESIVEQLRGKAESFIANSLAGKKGAELEKAMQEMRPYVEAIQSQFSMEAFVLAVKSGKSVRAALDESFPKAPPDGLDPVKWAAVLEDTKKEASAILGPSIQTAAGWKVVDQLKALK